LEPSALKLSVHAHLQIYIERSEPIFRSDGYLIWAIRSGRIESRFSVRMLLAGSAS
jgi:hypothetical protein